MLHEGRFIPPETVESEDMYESGKRRGDLSKVVESVREGRKWDRREKERRGTFKQGSYGLKRTTSNA
jgi:hypothetical protein